MREINFSFHTAVAWAGTATPDLPAASQGAEADRAIARSNRFMLVFGIETWALRATPGGGPGG
jgi:hypothetical protein